MPAGVNPKEHQDKLEQYIEGRLIKWVRELEEEITATKADVVRSKKSG